MLIHIEITGRVQGVGFRDWAVRTAKKMNVSGWVRNRIRGSVEILAEGADTDINAFLGACHKGPLWARVQSVRPVSVPDAVVLPIEPGIFTKEGTV